jgi:hypothetical protein
MVFTQLRLVLDALLQVSFVIENPSKDGVLNFLVILFLEEVIVEELHRPDQEKLASFKTHVEGTNGPVRRKTNWTTGQQRITRFPYVDSRSIGIDELEAAVLISIGQLILCVPVFLGVLTRLVLLCFSRSS